tara:strand:- start:6 stop:758 length:753 start_codon:yes stop_codon:yes gene_type:complete
MVQGNSARRKELAVARRQDRKNEVARKKAGASKATPVEARARILHHVSLSKEDTSAIAWCSIEQGKNICDSWFRTESCPRKRCRFNHTETIAHLLNVPESSYTNNGNGNGNGNDTDNTNSGKRKTKKGKSKKKKNGSTGSNNASMGGEGCLPAMVCKPLNAASAGGKLEYDPNVRTQRRTKSNLLFIEFQGELVFDAFHPSVFSSYAQAIAAASKCDKKEGKGSEEGQKQTQNEETKEVTSTNVEVSVDP